MRGLGRCGARFDPARRRAHGARAGSGEPAALAARGPGQGRQSTRFFTRCAYGAQTRAAEQILN